MQPGYDVIINLNLARLESRQSTAKFNLIMENNCKSALKIITTTGHSDIWLAWAMIKTGEKRITIEINETGNGLAITKKNRIADGINSGK